MKTHEWTFVKVGLLAAIFVALSGMGSLAIAPPFISDEELAKYPVIVIAKWDKAANQPHHRLEKREGGGQVATAIEAFTELNVVRVIRGDIQPGVQKLRIGYGISWSLNGDYVSSGTSTDIPAAVKDITKPVIWFLTKERSWDPKDEKQYLSVSNFREVQPLALESYFFALASDNPASEISKLFASDDTTLLFSLLSLVGDSKANDLSASVRSVVERKELKDVRPYAVSIYADSKGPACVDFMRTLLEDADHGVRGAAADALLHHRDSASIKAMTSALSGSEDGRIACSIIKAALAWGDIRLVPLLALFLENDDGSAGSRGDDIDTPALKARQALHQLTGHWFPFDPAAANRAWSKAADVKDADGRRKLLAKLLPGEEFPLKAEVLGDGSKKAICKVTNTTSQKMAISRLPRTTHLSWPAGLSGAAIGPYKDDTQSDFIALSPGESTQFDVTFSESFLLAEPASRKFKLQYTSTGRQWHLNAWMGLLPVKFGDGWKAERKFADVEEKWPNGNLKAKGRTLNGKKTGEWHFFNFYGDRIKIQDFTNGGVSTMNPDHPDNAGAGKKEK